MSVVKVDRATGSLVVDGRNVFPLVLSDGPPLGAKAPNGNDALAELAAGGAGFIRTGRHVWSSRSIEPTGSMLAIRARGCGLVKLTFVRSG